MEIVRGEFGKVKLIFFSDIHGNQYSFQQFLSQIQSLNFDKIIFLGDIFGYYYGQEEILNWLRKTDCVSIMGNHDRMFLDLLENRVGLDYLTQKYGSSYQRNFTCVSKKNIKFLEQCPDRYLLAVDGIRIGAFHGFCDDPLDGRIYPDTEIEDTALLDQFDFLFLGHTHHKMIRKKGKTWIINSGSLGQQRDGMGCSYSIFDTKSKILEMKCVDYDVNLLYQEVCEKDGNTKFAEVLYRKCKQPSKFYRSFYL